MAKSEPTRWFDAGKWHSVTGSTGINWAKIETQDEWLERQLRGLPVSWYSRFRGQHVRQAGYSLSAANEGLCKSLAVLTDARAAGLRLDATDEDVRNRAKRMAEHLQMRLRNKTCEFEQICTVHSEFNQAMLADYVPQGKSIESIVLRAKCELYWRRVLRKLFAQTVERSAIALGVVNRKAEKYCSDATLSRRRGQVKANQDAMERETLVNEYGQEMTLAKLAEKGQANKAVRHAELMTRLSGFDCLAEYAGHDGLFITVTCPSRMHKFAYGKNGFLLENQKYDGTAPREAHEYMIAQWAKCRAYIQRLGIRLYGFRMAEPHHDGCPHWHLLLFYEVAGVVETKEVCYSSVKEAIEGAFQKYFLWNDSASERGAIDRRLEFEWIDRSKGSAASYISKYISKNTSCKGLELENDLYGAPVVQSVQRVAAWASTWRIRQFQQIGGAPVGVWRELRRLSLEQLEAAGDTPQPVMQMVRGCNATALGLRAAHGYMAYTNAQGGAFVQRGACVVQLLTQKTGALNRYREECGADVIGVQFAGRVLKTRLVMGHEVKVEVAARAQYESERAQWVSKGIWAVSAHGEAVRPWTRVNNCTRTMRPVEVVGNVVMCAADEIFISRSKTGKFFRGAGGQTIEEKVKSWTEKNQQLFSELLRRQRLRNTMELQAQQREIWV